MTPYERRLEWQSKRIAELEAALATAKTEIAQLNECESELEKDWHRLNAYLEKALGSNRCHSAYEIVDALVAQVATAKKLEVIEELKQLYNHSIYVTREDGEGDRAVTLDRINERAEEPRKELK